MKGKMIAAVAALLASGVAGVATAQPRHFAPNYPPVAQELARIDHRIDQGVRNGALNGREAALLRRDLGSLAQLQARYQYDGYISRWEGEDLHRRADQLMRRVRYERQDPEYGHNGRGDRGHGHGPRRY